MKKNLLILAVLVLFVFLMTSCESFEDALDFSKFGSSARDDAESEKNDPFYDNEYDPNKPVQEQKPSDKAEENGTDNSEKSGDYDMNDSSFIMRAIVEHIEDKIRVNVYEAEYAQGIYVIIYGESTVFVDSYGNNISLSNLRIGDKIEITYNGQVMMSYPPQVAATRIKKL